MLVDHFGYLLAEGAGKIQDVNTAPCQTDENLSLIHISHPVREFKMLANVSDFGGAETAFYFAHCCSGNTTEKVKKQSCIHSLISLCYIVMKLLLHSFDKNSCLYSNRRGKDDTELCLFTILKKTSINKNVKK
ncbi:MAG: hypothetical protein ACRDDA_11260 [Aeromonas sp.]